MARQTASSSPIGATSTRLRRGGASSAGVHNRSMPARVITIMVARPDTIISPIRLQFIGTTAPLRTRPSILAILAMKPDRDARPDRDHAHKNEPPHRTQTDHEL